MDEQESQLREFERELTLLCRHFAVSRGPRAGQHLERSAYVLLTRLEVSESLTLKELAHTFQVDVSTINRQVSAMLRKGLVERIPDPDGGMARKYRPTALGLEQLAADRSVSLDGAARLIQATGWTEGTTQQFLALLNELNEGIGNLERIAWARTTDRRRGTS